MTEASQIRTVLIHGTQLLAELAAGSLAPESFVAQYGNFFHEHALDGHEATAAQQSEFQRFARATALHGELQGVVDLCYHSITAKHPYPHTKPPAAYDRAPSLSGRARLPPSTTSSGFWTTSTTEGLETDVVRNRGALARVERGIRGTKSMTDLTKLWRRKEFPDVDGHNVSNGWKMADSVRNLGRRNTRMGTYDADLNRIGD